MTKEQLQANKAAVADKLRQLTKNPKLDQFRNADKTLAQPFDSITQLDREFREQ